MPLTLHAKILARILALTLVVLSLMACTPRREVAQPSLPRAAPGHLQWLERQSLLGAAPDLTAQVSGSELLWRNSGATMRPHLLLEAAPNWLALHPYSLASNQVFFRALSASPLTKHMQQMGFQGLFIAPAGERGDIWTKDLQPVSDGDNVVSLRFDAALGEEGDFTRLAEQLEQKGIQIGGELPPAATGLGPDFFLQARRATRFDGLYAMLPVPQKDWHLLPELPDEWECLPLRPAVIESLTTSGLLPPLLYRDRLPWATPGGWAVTGEVRGADGQNRRWVYRYQGHPLRPVLLWQDPSGRARRIFSAAAIQHVGLQRQSLAGLRMEALMGLDVTGDSSHGHNSDQYSPGLEALDSTAREIHRYGGWAMQDDVLPPSLTPTVLAGATDFTREAAVPAAAALALLCEDAGPLADIMQRLLASGVDQSRLARGLHQWQAVDWRPLLDLPHGSELIQKAQKAAGATTQSMRLKASPAALAALALGLDVTAAPRSEYNAALRQAVLLLLSWRLGLPGLAFISPQELTGALALDVSTADHPFGLTPLWNAAGHIPGSAPPLPLVFGPLEMQWADSGSFLHDVARLLQNRQKYGLATGKVLQTIHEPPGCLTVVSSLPSGGYWLLAANFSSQPQKISCALPRRTTKTQDILHGHAVTLDSNGHRLALHLAPRQARHILLDPSRHIQHQGATP